jgi:DNA-directed RNA polymerase beta subunit
MINNNDTFKLIDLYFEKKFTLYKSLYESYEQFIEEIIYKELKEGENIFYEKMEGDKLYKYKFVFDDIRLKPPLHNNEEDYMWPEDARKKNLTYSSKLVATVRQIQEVIDIPSDTITRKVIGRIEHDVPIASIPIMVKSKYCTTNIKKEIPNTECTYDPGCYFIVNGNEKVVMSLERIIDNKMLVFTKKDDNYKDGKMYMTQVNSRLDQINGNIQIFTASMKRDESIIISTSYFVDIPIFILFRALGVISDHEIIKYIVHDMTDVDMVNIVKSSASKARMEPSKPLSSENRQINTQDDAIQFLINKLKYKKNYSGDEKTIKLKQRIYLLHILENYLLPHMGSNLTRKAYYIGLVINKLLSCYMGRTSPDDRDSYVNKRVDLPGILLGQLFKQYFKKLLNDCEKFFGRKNTSDENPINIINQIKPNTIEQGLKSALLTGTWGMSKSKKGVAQSLQRLTYINSISYLRRILTPAVDASTSKVVSIRNVHNVQYGFICPVESDGAKVGLVKSLAMMANITLNFDSQTTIIKNFLKDNIVDLRDVKPIQFKQMVKIFLNGEWLGISEKPLELINNMRKMKRSGELHKTISIVFNIGIREINIYSDGGRMFRPVLRVEDNKLLLTKEMIDRIAIISNGDLVKKDSITTWNQFLTEYPDVIDYIDVQDSETALIAMYPSEIDKEYQKMNTIIDKPNDERYKLNRYDETVYKKYNYCEFHPSMMLGPVVSNIPFTEHNESPRNIYYYSQAKQATGVYATNHRYRMVITYLLSHPQNPIVNTRSMKYIHTDKMAAGENAIVAIACYTG